MKNALHRCCCLAKSHGHLYKTSIRGVFYPKSMCGILPDACGCFKHLSCDWAKLTSPSKVKSWLSELPGHHPGVEADGVSLAYLPRDSFSMRM